MEKEIKIYFAGSIRGGRQDAEIYGQIISILKSFGTVLTEHVGDDKLTEKGENLSERKIHDRDLAWVKEADCLVAEITQPSTGVGYEIGMAVAEGKKVLCLYREIDGKGVSGMVRGCPNLSCRAYGDINEARSIIESFIRG